MNSLPGTESKESVSRTHSVLVQAELRLQRQLNTLVSNVACGFDDGVLHLQGRLATYYQKQLAQEAVLNIEGVERVVNDIRVVAAV